MAAIRELAHYVRWRLIPLRYTGKLRRMAGAPRLAVATSRLPQALEVQGSGYCAGPLMEQSRLQRIQAVYRPRVGKVQPTAGGHPFVNLFTADDIAVENDVFQLAFSPPILGAADDYFGGRLLLDSIQVLYSWPTHGQLHESQMWHKDYGDSKSFHWIAYLNDVQSSADGPFVFVDRNSARRIGRSAFIRRIDDDTFARELQDGKIRSFLGPAGTSLYMDPAVCYHYGSRCRNGRLAIFVTFNTDTPFVEQTPLVQANRERIFSAAQQLRPDLDAGYLRRILQLR